LLLYWAFLIADKLACSSSLARLFSRIAIREARATGAEARTSKS
jgi:hypothetical protein